jgi:hypothetical protein
MDVQCLGTFTGTILKVLDDGRFSVELDDGRIEIVNRCMCGTDDEPCEGQEIAAALMQFGKSEPNWVVFAFAD